MPAAPLSPSYPRTTQLPIFTPTAPLSPARAPIDKHYVSTNRYCIVIRENSGIAEADCILQRIVWILENMGNFNLKLSYWVQPAIKTPGDEQEIWRETWLLECGEEMGEEVESWIKENDGVTILRALVA